MGGRSGRSVIFRAKVLSRECAWFHQRDVSGVVTGRFTWAGVRRPEQFPRRSSVGAAPGRQGNFTLRVGLSRGAVRPRAEALASELRYGRPTRPGPEPRRETTLASGADRETGPNPGRVGGSNPARVGGSNPARVGGSNPARVGGSNPARVGGSNPARVGDARPRHRPLKARRRRHARRGGPPVRPRPESTGGRRRPGRLRSTRPAFLDLDCGPRLPVPHLSSLGFMRGVSWKSLFSGPLLFP